LEHLGRFFVPLLALVVLLTLLALVSVVSFRGIWFLCHGLNIVSVRVVKIMLVSLKLSR
jgi:hypothetical protein